MLKAIGLASLVIFAGMLDDSDEGRRPTPEQKCSMKTNRNITIEAGDYGGDHYKRIEHEKIFRGFLVDNWEYVDQGKRLKADIYPYRVLACNAIFNMERKGKEVANIDKFNKICDGDKQ